MRRLPFLPTLVVFAAVATMIALGVWQLQRASWKESLLAQYEANRSLPSIPYVMGQNQLQPWLFRRATSFCGEPGAIRAASGRNTAGVSGWSHVVQCPSNKPLGPNMSVDIGWSAAFDVLVKWRGGPVEGIIVPAGKDGIKLVATTPAPGLQASAPPSPDTISNNHRFYAAQWFFFAAVAALIYWLALRRRSGTGRE